MLLVVLLFLSGLDLDEPRLVLVLALLSSERTGSTTGTDRNGHQRARRVPWRATVRLIPMLRDFAVGN